jgi:hypothetical protein
MQATSTVVFERQQNRFNICLHTKVPQILWTIVGAEQRRRQTVR